MSAWTRIAVLAAGAAAGAAARRAASTDQARRAVEQAVERGRGALEPAAKDGPIVQNSPAVQDGADSQDGTAPSRRPAPSARENRLGSRVLRIAQDIRSGMDQAETELRGQFGRPSSSPSGTPRTAAAQLDPAGPEAAEQTIIDHDWGAQPAVDGPDPSGR